MNGGCFRRYRVWTGAFLCRLKAATSSASGTYGTRGINPADSDPLKCQINGLQSLAGPLSDDDRYIRIQIAVLQRCWWEFPKNVDCILDGIGTGRINLDRQISCEPPWSDMLEILRYQRQHPGAHATHAAGRSQTLEGNYALPSDRQCRAMAYMNILTWWIYGGDVGAFSKMHPEWGELAQHVYEQLGEPTALKRLYAGKMCATIAWGAIPASKWPTEASKQMTELFDSQIRQHYDDKQDPLGDMIYNDNICHNSYFRHLDRRIASVGAGHAVDLPDRGCERKRIHEAVTNYVHALGSWLARRTAKETIAIWGPAAATVEHVYEVLGEQSPRKRWLVACLWLQLSENQKHHGRGALDEDPERFALPPDAMRA